MRFLLFFFQAEDGIRDLVRSRGLGDVYKRQDQYFATLEIKGKQEAQVIYFNSILYEPKYFVYSGFKKDLQKLFDKSK